MNKHWEKATKKQIAWADKHGVWVAPEEDSDDVCQDCVFLRHDSCEDFPCGSLCDPRIIFKSKETKMSKEKVKLGVDDVTCRGFELVEFQDDNEQGCSLQISSHATVENEDGTVDNPLGWIWLGVDDATPLIKKTDARDFGLPLPPGEVTGWMPYPVPDEVLLHTRMHLGESQVRGLVARLQTWLDNGSLRVSEGKPGGEQSTTTEEAGRE